MDHARQVELWNTIWTARVPSGENPAETFNAIMEAFGTIKAQTMQDTEMTLKGFLECSNVPSARVCQWPGESSSAGHATRVDGQIIATCSTSRTTSSPDKTHNPSAMTVGPSAAVWILSDRTKGEERQTSAGSHMVRCWSGLAWQYEPYQPNAPSLVPSTNLYDRSRDPVIVGRHIVYEQVV